VSQVSSDYERRQVISDLIDAGDVDENLALSLIDLASQISSDYERGQLLTDLMEVSPQTKPVHNAL